MIDTIKIRDMGQRMIIIMRDIQLVVGCWHTCCVAVKDEGLRTRVSHLGSLAVPMYMYYHMNLD